MKTFKRLAIFTCLLGFAVGAEDLVEDDQLKAEDEPRQLTVVESMAICDAIIENYRERREVYISSSNIKNSPLRPVDQERLLSTLTVTKENQKPSLIYIKTWRDEKGDPVFEIRHSSGIGIEYAFIIEDGIKRCVPHSIKCVTTVTASE